MDLALGKLLLLLLSTLFLLDSWGLILENEVFFSFLGFDAEIDLKCLNKNLSLFTDLWAP